MDVNAGGNPSCPLCCSGSVCHYYRDRIREYLACHGCGLVYVPEQFWLDEVREKREYDLHINDVHDPGYRGFLSRLVEPLMERVELRCRDGLDFGCGPGPALAAMLEERGKRMALYDPYYFTDRKSLAQTYDFICATEVVEHLRHPQESFSLLFSLLRDGGVLALMTKLVRDREGFRSWHYIRDQTHICFYRRSTFEYIAACHGADVEFVADDVIFLFKTGDAR